MYTSFVTSAALVLAFLGDLPDSRRAEKLADIRAAWKIRNERVNSAKITWTETHFVPEGSGIEEDRREERIVFDESLVIDGQKIHVRSASRTAKVTNEQTFDGTRLMGLDARPAPYPYGEIVKSDYFSGTEYNALQPLLWAVRMDEPSFKTLLSDQAVLQTRRGNADGVECVILVDRGKLASEREQPGLISAFTREYWVAPSLGYSVVRKIVTTRSGLFSQMDVSYQPDPILGWRPKSWKYRFFAGGRLTEYSESVVEKFEINVEVKADEFELVFPPGAIVVDQTENKRWLVRENGEKRLVLENERRATYEQIKNSESGKALDETPSP